MKKVYSIEGIDCANCAAKIENKINKMKNIEEVNLNFMMEKLSIEFNFAEWELKVMSSHSHQSLAETQDRDVVGQLLAAQPLFSLWLNKKEGVLG